MRKRCNKCGRKLKEQEKLVEGGYKCKCGHEVKQPQLNRFEKKNV